jgi:methionyl-tRNA formyltransferase
LNIVVLTAEERLYLPAFFQRFLARRGASTRAIFSCPLHYGKQSRLDLIRQYRRTFGWANTFKIARKEGLARICDRLGLGKGNGRFHSVRAVAAEFRIPYETALDVNAESFRNRLRDLQTDVIASVSCPQIFKKPLIETPRVACLNVHGALLPKYRGIAPSFWMMRHGETQAGVTVFRVNEAIDRGDVIEVESFPILPDETLDEFIIRSKAIACDVLLRAIDKIESGTATYRPLAQEGGSYFGFPDNAAYREFRKRGRRIW